MGGDLTIRRLSRVIAEANEGEGSTTLKDGNGEQVDVDIEWDGANNVFKVDALAKTPGAISGRTIGELLATTAAASARAALSSAEYNVCLFLQMLKDKGKRASGGKGDMGHGPRPRRRAAAPPRRRPVPVSRLTHHALCPPWQATRFAP